MDYLATSYYEHWLAAIETLLEEGGMLDGAVVERRVAAGPTSPASRQDPDLVERVRGALRGARRRVLGRRRPSLRSGRPCPGPVDVTTHAGHTRCPRYVRGAEGVVVAACHASPLPEGLPERRIEPVPCYTVRVESRTLWGPDAEPFTVTVDLVEPYLEVVP